jgi:hypothetical protein
VPNHEKHAGMVKDFKTAQNERESCKATQLDDVTQLENVKIKHTFQRRNYFVTSVIRNE